MKKIAVVLLIVLTIFILTFGKMYYDHKVQAESKKSALEYNKYQKEDLKAQKEKNATLKKNRFNSVVDWLKYQSSNKDNINMSVFGSSVTRGAGANPNKRWDTLLTDFLNKQDGISPITLTNSGFGGYTTQRLIKENKIKDVLASKPDLIIIEPTIINNYLSDISIAQTDKDVLYFISQIRSRFPNALIIIQSSDRINVSEQKNQSGLTYQDYVNALKTFTQDNHLNYVDIYTGIEKLRNENNKSLNDILSDDRHPNDIGYEYWFETLKNSFESAKIVNKQ